MQAIITLIALIVLTAVGFIAMTPGVRDVVSAFVEIVSALLGILVALLGTNSIADWLQRGAEGHDSVAESSPTVPVGQTPGRPRANVSVGSVGLNLLMSVSFVAGAAVPAYFFGLTGASPRGRGVVGVFRDTVERIVDTFVSPTISPLTIKLATLLMLFVTAYALLRFLVAFGARTFGSGAGAVMQRVVGPIFLGFLAVGAIWSTHYTIAVMYGSTWGAAMLSLTVATIAMFALSRVQVRD